MRAVIDEVPAALTALRRLGRTLKQGATHVLASFARPRHLQRPHRGVSTYGSNTTRLHSGSET